MTIKLDYSINEIKAEARHLVDIEMIDRQQLIYVLSQFFPAGEWALVECELETNGYSLVTNSIADLLDED